VNTQPKCLASTTLTELRWANTTGLSGDVAAAIGELKTQPAGELQVHGSASLSQWLFDNQLVDEITLLTVPGGRRPGHAAIPDTGPDTVRDLVDSRASPLAASPTPVAPNPRTSYSGWSTPAPNNAGVPTHAPKNDREEPSRA